VNNRRACILLFTLLTGEMVSAQEQAANENAPHEIVFVCEHGAALSVIAAAYFNRLAKEQNLGFHAVSRGVAPQENLSQQAAAGLKQDGLTPDLSKPLGLSQEELGSADGVVTFLPIPKGFASKSPVEDWSDVTWGPGSYERSRDAILDHMGHLLTRLKRAATKE
jgi:arsenate reductase